MVRWVGCVVMAVECGAAAVVDGRFAAVGSDVGMAGEVWIPVLIW